VHGKGGTVPRQRCSAGVFPVTVDGAGAAQRTEAVAQLRLTIILADDRPFDDTTLSSRNSGINSVGLWMDVGLFFIVTGVWEGFAMARSLSFQRAVQRSILLYVLRFLRGDIFRENSNQDD
jgi:hypothetical protein